MGKSRLVAEFARTVERRGDRRRGRRVPVVRHEHELLSSGARSGRRCFASTTACREDEQVRALEAELAAIDPALVPRAPLLGGLLGLPDSRQRPHRVVRREAAQDLARGPARRLPARAGAAKAPIVLVLEDCHWLDPLSRDLLEVLGRAAGRCQRPARARVPPGQGRRQRARAREPAALRRDRAGRARGTATRCS